MQIRLLLFFNYLFGVLFSFFLGETVYFSYLYHPDNLYLPVFFQDLSNTGSVTHWNLPPSSYFFPDGALVFLVGSLFPFLYLPSIYGCFVFFILQTTVYLYYKKYLGKRKATLGLSCFSFLFLVSSSFFFFDGEKKNPLGMVLTNGHHLTGFIFSILIILLLNQKKRKNLPSIFYFSALGLFYGSDRYLLLVLLLPFLSSLFITKSRKKNYYFLFCVFVLFVGEVFQYWVRSSFYTPNSLADLWFKISSIPSTRFAFLTLHYYYDFLKLFFSNTGIYFSLTLLLFSSVFLLKSKSNLPFREKSFWIFLTFYSFCFTGIIGRFLYQHPFPIRYLAPSLLCFFVFGIHKLLSQDISFRFRRFSHWILILLSAFYSLFLYSLFRGEEMPRDRAVFLIGKIEGHFKDQILLTDYSHEKTLRFWSQGRLKPLPMDTGKRPYLWVTGAYLHPFWNREEGLSLQIKFPHKEWIPNSLTKDF